MANGNGQAPVYASSCTISVSVPWSWLKHSCCRRRLVSLALHNVNCRRSMVVQIMFFGHPVERLCTYQYSLVTLIPGEQCHSSSSRYMLNQEVRSSSEFGRLWFAAISE